MESKLVLSQKKILEKVFTPNVKGYDPGEVDAFLDLVIEDYDRFARYQEECTSYINSLEVENSKIKEEKKNLEIENANFHRKLDGIKEGDRVNAENMAYIQRIRQLESFLYAQGFDPRKIK
ncbi:MAG: DivIVA domain-containing protein [Bacilli bacterium]|nr:DivIVA domain-containing protein [Bacilli bacterium]